LPVAAGEQGMAERIGADVRALRKARGITLVELSAAVGRSVGWLSQVERGLAEPSVRDLGLIAERLGVSLSLFFRSASKRAEEQGIVLRAEDRAPIGSRASGLVEELLSPSLAGSFEMIRSTFAPGADSGGPRSGRGREDGGVVVSGRLCLTIDGVAFDLGPGDSFQFAGRDYAWRNPGDAPTVVLWIIAPPVY
jgi:transcriptional regulator with XRE-family HTH domain